MPPEGKDTLKGQACWGCQRHSLRLEGHPAASSLQTGPLQQGLREPWLQYTALTELRHCPIVPCHWHCVSGSSHACYMWAGIGRM
jgi:hypothetical protein